MKHNNVSQAELARKIGCNDSLLSRFLSEKTDKHGCRGLQSFVSKPMVFMKVS